MRTALLGVVAVVVILGFAPAARSASSVTFLAGLTVGYFDSATLSEFNGSPPPPCPPPRSPKCKDSYGHDDHDCRDY